MYNQPTPSSSNQPTTRTAVTFSPFAARQIKHIYGFFSFSQIKRFLRSFLKLDQSKELGAFALLIAFMKEPGSARGTYTLTD